MKHGSYISLFSHDEQHSDGQVQALPFAWVSPSVLLSCLEGDISWTSSLLAQSFAFHIPKTKKQASKRNLARGFFQTFLLCSRPSPRDVSAASAALTVGLNDLKTSSPTKTILWFYVYVMTDLLWGKHMGLAIWLQTLWVSWLLHNYYYFFYVFFFFNVSSIKQSINHNSWPEIASVRLFMPHLSDLEMRYIYYLRWIDVGFKEYGDNVKETANLL